MHTRRPIVCDKQACNHQHHCGQVVRIAELLKNAFNWSRLSSFIKYSSWKCLYKLQVYHNKHNIIYFYFQALYHLHFLYNVLALSVLVY